MNVKLNGFLILLLANGIVAQGKEKENAVVAPGGAAEPGNATETEEAAVTPSVVAIDDTTLFMNETAPAENTTDLFADTTTVPEDTAAPVANTTVPEEDTAAPPAEDEVTPVETMDVPENTTDSEIFFNETISQDNGTVMAKENPQAIEAAEDSKAAPISYLSAGLLVAFTSLVTIYA